MNQLKPNKFECFCVFTLLQYTGICHFTLLMPKSIK